MNTNLIEIIKAAVAAGNNGSWQYQAGLLAGGVAMGVIGSVAGWVGKQFWNKKRKAKK